MRGEPALGAAKTLSRQSPQQTLTLDAEGGRCGRKHDKVVRCCARYWINQRLQRLFVHMLFLHISTTFTHTHTHTHTNTHTHSFIHQATADIKVKENKKYLTST